MNTDYFKMKRKRTIANLLQDTNTLNTPVRLINTDSSQQVVDAVVATASKRVDSEKKTFVKEYFDTNNNLTTILATSLDDLDTTSNSTTINDQHLIKRAKLNENEPVLINKSSKKSKIKDYVFNGNNNNNTNNNSSIVSILLSENNKISTTTTTPTQNETKKKTIGSLINTKSNDTNKNFKPKTKESKKSKIKDYIQIETLDNSSLSNDTLISQINISTPTTTNTVTPLVSTHINNNLNDTTFSSSSSSTSTRTTTKLNNLNNKTKRTKIKDYITSLDSLSVNDLLSVSNLIDKNDTIKHNSNTNKRFNKSNLATSTTNKKMKVKNHLLQQELQHQKEKQVKPEPIIQMNQTNSTSRSTATNNKSTIKEYLQKNQRNKLINNKENLMSKRLYFKNKS